MKTTTRAATIVESGCDECGHPYKEGDETHYPECSRLNQQSDRTEAAPLPWNCDHMHIKDAKGQIVASVLASLGTRSNAELDEIEQRIVTAVNNHDALLAVLERIDSLAHSAANGKFKVPGKSESIRDLKDAFRQIRDDAREALAAVRKEQH